VLLADVLCAECESAINAALQACLSTARWRNISSNLGGKRKFRSDSCLVNNVLRSHAKHHVLCYENGISIFHHVVHAVVGGGRYCYFWVVLNVKSYSHFSCVTSKAKVKSPCKWIKHVVCDTRPVVYCSSLRASPPHHQYQIVKLYRCTVVENWTPDLITCPAP